MNIRKSMIALALATLSVGSVYAQSGGSGAGAGGGGNTHSNTTFQEWLNEHSAKSGGRVSRQAYMDEASRRWDTMDKNKQGLTAAEVRGMYSGPAAVMGGPTSTNSQDKKGIKQ